MNISIDQDACTGCELCAKTCPDLFQMKDKKAMVRSFDIPVEREFICKLVAKHCPGWAIYVGQAQALMLASDGTRTPSRNTL